MIKKILFVMLFLLFICGGLLFQLPVKKVIEKQVIYDPYIVYQKEIVEKEVDIKGDSITVHGVGVYNETIEGSYGEIIDIVITVKDGAGRNFFDTTGNAFGTDIQESIDDIRYAVQDTLGYSAFSQDIYINVDVPGLVVSGTSGNAFIGVGLAALLEGKKIDSTALITGSLTKTGQVAQVGQLDKKLKIVESSGFKKFLVPSSQCNEISSSKVQIICVATLSEAVDKMLVE